MIRADRAGLVAPLRLPLDEQDERIDAPDNRRHHLVKAVELVDAKLEALAPHRTCVFHEIEQADVDLVLLAVAGDRAVDHIVKLVRTQGLLADHGERWPVHQRHRRDHVEPAEARETGADLVAERERKAVIAKRAGRKERQHPDPQAIAIGFGHRLRIPLARRWRRQCRLVLVGTAEHADRFVERNRLQRRLHVQRCLQGFTAAGELAQRLRSLAHVGERPHQHA